LSSPVFPTTGARRPLSSLRVGTRRPRPPLSACVLSSTPFDTPLWRLPWPVARRLVLTTALLALAGSVLVAQPRQAVRLIRARRRLSEPPGSLRSQFPAPVAAPESVGLSIERLRRIAEPGRSYGAQKQIAGAVTHRPQGGRVAQLRGCRHDGCREWNGHANRHHLPHGVHVQGGDQRRSGHAHGRGPATLADPVSRFLRPSSRRLWRCRGRRVPADATA